MAEIDKTIWGDEEDWVDIISNYDSGVPVKERIQYASLDSTDASTIENYILAHKINTSQPIDQSLCYGALGDKMPLSNISNTAGAVGWRNEEDGNTPYRSYIANLQTSGNRDTREATNYVFGTWTTPVEINMEKGAQLYIRQGQRSDRFHQFWIPDSLIGNVSEWSSGDKEYNPTINTKLLARIPVKNMIAIPRVKCLSDVTATGATASYVDLLDYINPQSNINYTTHPYVVTVGLVFATAQGGVTETNINRNLTIRLNTCVITSPTNMMKNMPYYQYGGWDKNARYNDYAYHYASCIGSHYRNSVDCMMPIMGLINAPLRTDTKFQDVNVKSDRDGNWDLFDVRFDLGTTEQATLGGGYALPMYSWAGKEPNIYLVEDHDPNHTDGQKYQNSTTYWAWEINASNVEEFRQDVRHATAGFGLFFVEGDANRNLPLDDENMFLGILEDGVGNGEYSHGPANRNQDQWNWDDMHENDYNPLDPPVPDDGKTDPYNTSVLPNRGLFSPYSGSWIMDNLALYDVIDASTDFYIAMQNAIEDYNTAALDWDFTNPLDFDSYLQRQWGGKSNPIDCFTSIVHYPFNIKTVANINTSGQTRVQVGSWVPDHDIITSGALCDKVGLATQYGIIDCGSVSFPVTGTDFRDYEPYTTATLYVPFCGSVQLECQVYAGYSVRLKYLVDWRTGMCLALVYRDNLIMEVLPGTMGNRINLSMQDVATYTGQLANAAIQEQGLHKQRFNNFLGTVGNLVKIAAGVAITAGSDGALSPIGLSMMTSGATGLVGNYQSMSQRKVAENSVTYNIATAQVPTRQISTATASVNACNEMVPRIVLIKSVEEDATNYGHTVGYACLKYGALKDISTGYTVCQTIDTNGINATETEKEQIRSLLTGGVYV